MEMNENDPNICFDDLNKLIRTIKKREENYIKLLDYFRKKSNDISINDTNDIKFLIE